jgi:hypothetical protein
MNDEKYAGYVEHPRYGKGARHTGLDPDCWISKSHGGNVIPGTAVEADVSKQINATVSIPYYFDVDQLCRKCGRRFIFFAEEQKYWYEELGFYLWSAAVCCPPCRKELQSIRRMKKRYEQLIHVPNRTVDETIEMANDCLTLVEEGVFNVRQTEHVRAVMNQVPAEQRVGSHFEELAARLRDIEKLP